MAGVTLAQHSGAGRKRKWRRGGGTDGCYRSAYQYQRRRQKFDFDRMIGSWLASASPGNEQRSRWGSASADQEASFNLAGVKSPAVDAMINALLAAKTDAEFVAAVRAYDRVLLSGFYIVPLFHAQDQWIAASAKLARPHNLPRYGPASGAPSTHGGEKNLRCFA